MVSSTRTFHGIDCSIQVPNNQHTLFVQYIPPILAVSNDLFQNILRDTFIIVIKHT